MRTFINNLVMAVVMGTVWNMYYTIMATIAGDSAELVVPAWTIYASQAYEYIMTLVVLALPITLIIGIVNVIKSKSLATA